MSNLISIPSPPAERYINYPRLDGGINTSRPDYALAANESPRLLNLWWRDGGLCSRDGQNLLAPAPNPAAIGWSACPTPFGGSAFFHIGDTLCYAPLGDPDGGEGSLVPVPLVTGVPQNRGSWFTFGSRLCYKNRGGYYAVTPTEDGFEAAEVEAYTPIVSINTDPDTAAGDLYQPVNRLSPRKTLWYTAKEGVKDYHLPEGDIDGILSVTADGAEAAYTADLKAGIVTFDQAPRFHDPVQANTVVITYAKGDGEMERSITDCPCAMAFGGGQEVCVVMGGCENQPNAYFWSGSHGGADLGYFPENQYNLAEEGGGAVTAFGKQQSMLVIFQEKSVGRAALSVTEMDSGRALMTLDYVPINATIGCDLPHTVQLVGNNLVFCSSRRGVCLVRDSSAAGENNIAVISSKVERELLALLRRAERVTSFDDGSRYWLAACGEVYLWDYSLSGWSDPSWFHLNGIAAAAFFSGEGDDRYHLGEDGSVTSFRRNFADYGSGIPKVLQFPTHRLDGRGDVVEAEFVLRGDRDADIRVVWLTDGEEREDLTPLRAYSHRLSPRDLGHRFLALRRFATAERRRPGCRRVGYFAMVLSDDRAGTDLAVVSARVKWRSRNG